MCGIAGFTHLGEVCGRGIAQTINESLTHRGPDQQGYFESATVTLCAVRLKVIDLDGGDQPFVSENGNTIVVFNGEIYNHREVRADLESRGYRFRSHCDTETLLAAFQEWDTGCWPRLRGMFAVAIWSERQKRLVLARDRLGIKPLYYYCRGNDLCFGSELKAILAHADVPRHMDADALGAYLSVNYVPGPATLIAGIRKVPPGHFLDWREGSWKLQSWWSLPAPLPRKITFGAAKEELDTLLRDSVREHLVADVPLGVWESGGLDSSTILHYAAQESSRPVQTFSVSFAGRSFDESRYFREMARIYGTDHHEIDFNPGLDLTDAIQELAYFSDEPSADAGALPVWYLSRLSRRHVTVALSGEGADELFGGYATYLADRTSRPMHMLPIAAVRLMRWAAGQCLPVSDEKISLEYKVKRWLEGSCLDPDEAHFFWNGTFSNTQRKQICPNSNGNGLRALVNALPAAGSGLNRYLHVDQSYYLPDDILYKTDRMSMAHSLEVRPPFLDHRLVEFAASLPMSFKINGWRQKYLLRELMRGKLPAAVIERKKTGFDIPAHDWFRGPLRTLLLDTLTPEAVEATGIFDARAIRRLIRDHMERRINVGYHLWGLLTLFLWMKRWRVQTLPLAEAAARAPDRVLATN